MCNNSPFYDQSNKQTNNPYAGINAPTNANMQPVNDTFRTSSQFGANQYAPQPGPQLTYKTSSGTIHRQKEDPDFMYGSEYEDAICKYTGLSIEELDKLDHEKGTYGATDYLFYDAGNNQFLKLKNNCSPGDLENALRLSESKGYIFIKADVLSEKGIKSLEKSNIYKTSNTIEVSSIGAWLQNMSAEDLDKIWKDESKRKSIAALLRNPGNYHEWMMISMIPRMKQMKGIDLNWVTEYRDSTTNDFGGWEHGSYLSGVLHNLLRMAFMYADSPHELANNLKTLISVTNTTNAQGLYKLISRLEQMDAKNPFIRWDVVEERDYKEAAKAYYNQKTEQIQRLYGV